MPLPVGFINDCAELVESERGYIVEYAVIAYEVTAIGIDLDPVGAETDLLSDRFSCLIRAVHQLDTMRHLDFRTVALERVCARDIHGAGGNLHSRTGNYAVVDGFFQINVGIAGALRFKVANRGESVLQGAFY